MQHYEWKKIETETLSPTFSRQCIHSETMTIARIYMKKGCLVPRHHHHNEQVSTMEQGSMKFLIEDREIVLHPGESLRIPANVPHSAEALEDCIALDLFSPPREDWKNGTDAYLRR